MSKPDVESILLANWYFINCKHDNKNCDKSDIARKYLILRIRKALFERSKSNKSPIFNII